MTIELKALTVGQEIRHFFFYVNELEAGFDFLNFIVERGEELLSVELTEDGSQTSLPVKAFDGVPSSLVIEQLKRDWLLSLASPARVRQWTDSVVSRQYRERLDQCEQRIINLELLADHAASYVEANDPFHPKSEQITARCQSLLRLYKVQLKYVHLRRRLLLDLLYPIYT